MSSSVITPVGQKKELYCGRLVRVVSQDMQLGDGRVVPFEWAERSPGVRVLVQWDDRILLTREYRTEQEGFDFRLPGGKVFDSLPEFLRCDSDSGGTPEATDMARAAASRELHEETTLGVDADQLDVLHKSRCGATVRWDLYYFLAMVDVAPDEFTRVCTEEGEVVEPMWIPLVDVKRMCLEGLVKEDRTAAVLLRYILNSLDGANSACPAGI